MALKFSNNASSLLAADISNVDVTVTITAGTGVIFPTTADGTFLITVQDSTGNNEIMLCTARTTDFLTVTRAQEGTLAKAFSTGAVVENRFTAGSINSFAQTANVQPLDAGLTSISGLTTAADNIIYTTALDTYATASCTAAGRAILDDADATAQRTTLGLGTMSVLNSTDVFSRRNRLCNGDFRVDNINAGAEVTLAATGYVVDNTFLGMTQASKITAQRVADSLASYPYSEKLTVASAYTVLAADGFTVQKRIEGFDFADLLWGTAQAKECTISFTVRVSVAGPYAFGIRNALGTYTYMFTRTLAANTETYVNETVPGCTAGVWAKTNTLCAVLMFSLGGGVTYSTATTGVWQNANYLQVSGTVQFVENAAATYEIGGVQIEKGSFATPFEVLPYQQAEAWCQRYHPTYRVSPGVVSNVPGYGVAAATTYTEHILPLRVASRIAPTGVVVSNGAHFAVGDGVTLTTTTGITFNASGTDSVGILAVVAAGLTQFRPASLRFSTSGSWMRFTGAEL